MDNTIYNTPGELHVEVVRPALRFGLAIQIYKTERSKTWHFRPAPGGELVATEVEPYSYPDQPTLYIDDEVAEKLLKALSNTPIYTKGEETVTHLKDTIVIRDRLMALVEHVVKQPQEER